MTYMSGGASIVQSLIRHGVDTVFGLPGVQTYSLFDELWHTDDKINVFGARHEQGAAYMALGYAKSTGRVGTFMVVPGPGVLNTTAALCTALGCNTPVLCVTGQVPSAYLSKGRGHLHELPDQLATVRSITKWAKRIEHPTDVPMMMREAFRQMHTGRPGPVVLEMCWDIMEMEAEVKLLKPTKMDQNIPLDLRQIKCASKMLREARHPMIMVGGGP